MNNKGLTLLEVVVIIVVIGILACLVLPSAHHPGIRQSRKTACAQNLRQLYQLATVYSSQHQGEWLQPGEEGLWLGLARTQPPLIEPEWLEVLLCPVLGESEPGDCDFRASRLPYPGLAKDDVLGADKEGNHGEEYGGNVLLKDGSVQEVERKDPLWKLCAGKLAP